MRISTLAMAVCLGIAAPFALSTTAAAQTLVGLSPEAALENELIAAAGDPAAIQAIIAREQGSGNGARVARALARAAQIVVLTDTAGGAALAAASILAAINTGDADLHREVGEAASAVSSTAAANDDTEAVRAVESAIAASSSDLILSTYRDAGASAGTPLSGPPQDGQPTIFRPTSDNDDGGPSALPSDDLLPSIPEPNPAQIVPVEVLLNPGSPT